MSVVVKISGKQYLVSPGDKFVVDRLEQAEDEIIDVPVIIALGGAQTSMRWE